MHYYKWDEKSVKYEYDSRVYVSRTDYLCPHDIGTWEKANPTSSMNYKGMVIACIRNKDGKGHLPSTSSRARKIHYNPAGGEHIKAEDSVRGWCNDLEN